MCRARGGGGGGPVESGQRPHGGCGTTAVRLPRDVLIAGPVAFFLVIKTAVFFGGGVGPCACGVACSGAFLWVILVFFFVLLLVVFVVVLWLGINPPTTVVVEEVVLL